jgi:HAD superfamily hydrolase (TIGR01549 family)
VVFDLGETLVDETANWGRWADYLGVPHLTFFGLLGAAIGQRRDHTDAFHLIKEGFDLPSERVLKAEQGHGWDLDESDLYPDAMPTLERLAAKGFRLAVMANQPLESQSFMETLPVDMVATSAGWGLAKPDPAFFARVAAETGEDPSRIAYVGDRLDNDVLPAKAAGMLAVHVRRGPWGYLHSSWPEAEQADLRLTSLEPLPDLLECSGAAEPH